jgi:hypothetical protein
MSQVTGGVVPDITGALTTWLNKNFIIDLEYLLQHQKFTTKAIVPKGSGNKGRFLAFAQPGFAKSYSGDANMGTSGDGTIAIAEASTTANEISAITQTSTDITIAEFGEFTKVGTMYEYAAVPGLRQELLKRLRDGAAFSIDRVVLKKALLTTTRLFATMTQTGATTTAPANMTLTPLGAAGITAATKTLFANLAPTFTNGSVPNNQYAAVITPQQEQDIITEFTTQRMSWSNSVVQTPGPMGVERWSNGYIGSIYRTAVVVTQNYTTQLYTVSTEVAVVYSDGGVGAMAFQDMNPEIIINELNSPYKNVNTFAWHINFGAGLIDSNRVVKIYSTT